jgi:hypothetical protein
VGSNILGQSINSRGLEWTGFCIRVTRLTILSKGESFNNKQSRTDGTHHVLYYVIVFFPPWVKIKLHEGAMKVHLFLGMSA